MTNIFWSNDPTILFNKNYITELWPSSKMSYDEKLNAITRLIIILSLLGTLITSTFKFIIIGLITIIIIFIFYKLKKPKLTKESFISNDKSVTNDKLIDPSTLKSFLKSDFATINKKNPLGNVLLTDINDNPNRKSAPPSFNTEVYEDINNNTKKMIQTLNPGIKNTNRQLFGDLGEKFEFDQSMWQYYSNPNTKVCNDQGAYAKFLYGNMPSAKEGNEFALLQDNPRYNLY